MGSTGINADLTCHYERKPSKSGSGVSCIGAELMYDRKYDFEGYIYIDKAEVGENSSSSSVAQNKYGLCNKEEETEKLSSAAKGREVEGQALKVESTILYVVSCLELHHTKINYT